MKRSLPFGRAQSAPAANSPTEQRTPRRSAWTLLTLVLATACRDSVTGPTEQRLRLGSWAESRIGLEVKDSATEVRHTCGEGSIPVPIFLDSNGRFDVSGEFTPKVGTHPARYSGIVTSDRMDLTVWLTDSGESIGTFSLSYGVSHGGRLCR